ncbi:breast cancer anti-estrogen resistance protein 1-like isoform X2 [Saccoglossus kowalevskii]|uniref:Breast cancer anti-estrogen resistance protein 1-like isoform X1 n=1 Tax=Saccoglossus kowalevskii TaxID=10224 RepID=A0ABM0GJ29_SACKO|nr:PREDICTED: breast cancer anti-estrogen resistance protein 1-like isoform X1 [Saccoglossus kowalevskii]
MAVRVLAKALYENVAEAPDELAFRKGDVVTVIEQNTNGLEGWWLCSLNGRQGIAPGNRLKLLAGMYDNPHELRKMMGKSPQQQGTWGKSPTKTPTLQRPRHLFYQGGTVNTSQDEGEDYDVPPTRYPPNFQMTSADSQEMYDTPRSMAVQQESPEQELYDVPPSHHLEGNLPTEIYDIPPSHGYPTELYDVPPSHHPTEPYNHSQSHIGKIPTEMYDVPPRHDFPAQGSYPEEVYDVPPEHIKSLKPTKTTALPDHLEEDYDVPNPFSDGSETYDVPPSVKGGQYPEEFYDVPPKHLAADLYDVPKSMGVVTVNKNDNDDDYVYDVPPQVTRDRQDVIGTPGTQSIITNVNSSMSGLSVSECKLLPARELNIDLDAAMDMLVKLQQRVASSVSHLLSFVSSSWRRRSSLEPKIYEIRAACNEIKTVLRDIIEFGRGAAVNSAKATDYNLQRKLKNMLQPLEDTLIVISKSWDALEDINWQVTKLCMTESLKTPDDLDQIVMCARSMPDDTRQLTSVIHGNSNLIFKRARQNSNSPVQCRPLPNPPGSVGQIARVSPRVSPTASPIPSMKLKSNWMKNEAEKEMPLAKEQIQTQQLAHEPGKPTGSPEKSEKAHYGKGWLDDYDYVHLEGKEEFEKRQKKILNEEGDVVKQEQLQQHQKKQFEALEKDATKSVDIDPSKWTPPQSNRQSILAANDKHLLTFYADQMNELATSLNNAIDAFFNAVKTNQPPKMFVAHGKFVVLCAHKLVFIGDTLYRNISNTDVRNKVMHCTDCLCQCLKVTVSAIKTAALQYPSIQAIQEMVDRVSDISHGSQNLKSMVFQSASL